MSVDSHTRHSMYFRRFGLIISESHLLNRNYLLLEKGQTLVMLTSSLLWLGYIRLVKESLGDHSSQYKIIMLLCKVNPSIIITWALGSAQSQNWSSYLLWLGRTLIQPRQTGQARASPFIQSGSTGLKPNLC